MAYLLFHHFIPISRFACRQNNSTEDTLVLAASRWSIAKSERTYTGVVFVDVSKAFDRVKRSCSRWEWLVSHFSAFAAIYLEGFNMSGYYCPMPALAKVVFRRVVSSVLCKCLTARGYWQNDAYIIEGI